MDIRHLFLFLLVFLCAQCRSGYEGMIMTVDGPVSPDQMGIALTHEHVLVDFIGADSINYERWDKNEAAAKILPYLLDARKHGTRTFVECTPEFIGRDPILLKILSKQSGLMILTNTGYYGASQNKFIPGHAYNESADELSIRWTKEWENGIEGTGVKPGFIKIGVAGGELTDLHRKLISAAARTHLATGLTIVSHTGPEIAAFAQLEVLRETGVSPEAFVWVHAQSAKDMASHVKAALTGAWISFDGLNENNADHYVSLIQNMKANNLTDHVLISHDAGWYKPGEPGGGNYNGYTALFEKLLPALRQNGFSENEIHQLIVENPARAFTIRIRKLK